jgi:hypothetical protein
MIKRENVIRVYSGKSGCMCGCNGTYSKPKSSSCNEGHKVSETHVSRVLNFLADNAKEVRYQHISGNEWCAYIDGRSNSWAPGSGRNNVVYYMADVNLGMMPFAPTVLPLPKTISV